MPRPKPSDKAKKRAGSVQPPIHPKDFYDREAARAIGSSRIGEIRRAENPPKMGMGDVRRRERRDEYIEDARLNRIAHRMLKGPKKAT